jgi:hypothetical protein
VFHLIPALYNNVPVSKRVINTNNGPVDIAKFVTEKAIAEKALRHAEAGQKKQEMQERRRQLASQKTPFEGRWVYEKYYPAETHTFGGYWEDKSSAYSSRPFWEYRPTTKYTSQAFTTTRTITFSGRTVYLHWFSSRARMEHWGEFDISGDTMTMILHYLDEEDNPRPGLSFPPCSLYDVAPV